MVWETVLYVFYKQNPGLLPANFNIDSIVPYFIINEMPAGIAGLLVAAIFAAAQSTISTQPQQYFSMLCN